MDADKLSKIAGIRPEAAKIALSDSRWKKWLEDRKEQVESKARLAKLHMVSGVFVDENRYDDQEVMREMYEEYLRMAQMDQRSRITSVNENGRVVGKRIFLMTFDEYVMDGLRNLDWRINQDIPTLIKIESEGGIGITEAEAELSIKIAKQVKRTIQQYLEMPEEKRLLYV